MSRSARIALFSVVLVAAAIVPFLIPLAKTSHRPTPVASSRLALENQAAAAHDVSGSRSSEVEHEAKMLSDALSRKPDHVPVLMRLATLAAGQGRKEEALNRLREAIRHEPDNLEARLELGKMLFEKGDAQGAIQQTKEILKRKPEHPDALYNLGAIYANLGDHILAAKLWEKLLASSPGSESGKRARTMLAQLKKGNS